MDWINITNIIAWNFSFLGSSFFFSNNLMATFILSTSIFCNSIDQILLIYSCPKKE